MTHIAMTSQSPLTFKSSGVQPREIVFVQPIQMAFTLQNSRMPWAESSRP
jgi:hypothetical protein